ncbi:hypothetical protein A0H81_08450 [Grifola frondosa]|uniref:Wax synthase domain-containing protein n=1 Tax=Grifola frondosa TaxID=5627 RepID=A0A1C7M2V1_GRIFR|nr:hypothetical protein A0H81_08450 [Grifola frondosa]
MCRRSLDLFLCFLIAVRPSTPIKLSAFLVYACIALRGVTAFSTGDELQDYSIGSSISGQLLTACHLLWLTDPLKDFKYNHESVQPQSLPLWRRIYWAICVDHSPRGIGWNYQVTNVPPPPTSPRGHFIRTRILRAVRSFLLLDLAQSYIHLNPLFASKGADALPIEAQNYLLRCLSIVAFCSTPYGMMNMQYSLLSVIHVVLGLSEPSDWPDVYGSWSDAYTVRRFWGRTWHQMLRRYVTSIGRYVTRSFRIAHGTWQSSYTQLYVGFIVSGIMHSCGGDLMVGKEFLGASFPFFIAQAMAITCEDIAIGAMRRMGIKGPATVIFGYVWVFVWFSISGPLYINWAVRAGLGQSELLPFSLVRALIPAHLLGF